METQDRKVPSCPWLEGDNIAYSRFICLHWSMSGAPFNISRDCRNCSSVRFWVILTVSFNRSPRVLTRSMRLVPLIASPWWPYYRFQLISERSLTDWLFLLTPAIQPQGHTWFMSCSWSPWVCDDEQKEWGELVRSLDLFFAAGLVACMKP